MNETTRNDNVGWGALAAVAAAATYALIVFGGVVRITGSGMGCGDDWPLCNGQLIPPMDFETLIEYGHRLAALGVSTLVVALAAWAWWPARGVASRHPGPVRSLSALAFALLVVQILLGAVTVWLGLPPGTVILHLGTALALLGVLTVGACVGLTGGLRPRRRLDRTTKWVIALAAYAFGVSLLGGLVASLEAGPACLGFPACNGSWMPGGSGLVHVHWTHRLAAYLLVLLLLGLPLIVRRGRPEDGAAGAWSLTALILGLGQVAVAALMVLRLFPSSLRAAHLAAGAALVGALVVVAWLVWHPGAGPGGRRRPGGERRAFGLTKSRKEGPALH